LTSEELLTNTFPPTPERLPLSTKPVNYDLLLKVYYSPSNQAGANRSSYYFGQVTTLVKVVEPVNRFVLHASSSVYIIHPIVVINVTNNETITIGKSNSYYSTYETYVILLPVEYTIGDYEIKIEFKSDFLPDNLKGFYKFSYKENDTTSFNILATNFLPTYARAAL
jgi:hypothetical protein